MLVNKLCSDDQKLSTTHFIGANAVLMKKLGRTTAIFLSQLHYWITNEKCRGLIHHGRKYIYNTADEWGEQLQLSARQVQRLIAKLSKMGILIVEKLHKLKSVRTNYYSINYGHLKKFLGLEVASSAISDDSKEVSLPLRHSDSSNDKVSYPLRHSDVMYIQILPTNTTFIKSKKRDFSENSVVETNQVDLVEQVEENINNFEEEERKHQSVTVRDWLSTFNEIMGALALMSKSIAQYLGAARNKKFAKSMAEWRQYLEWARNNEDDKSINNILDFRTIDRFRSKNHISEKFLDNPCSATEDNTSNVIDLPVSNVKYAAPAALVDTATDVQKAHDMIARWNLFLGDKAPARISNENIGLLSKAFKTNFNSKMLDFENYIEQLKSSKYLMGDSFSLTPEWALKPETIDKIRKGEMGVKITAAAIPVDDEKVLRLIEISPHSEAIKQWLFEIYKQVGAGNYYSFFHNAKYSEQNGVLSMEPEYEFLMQRWELEFSHVNKQKRLNNVN